MSFFLSWAGLIQTLFSALPQCSSQSGFRGVRPRLPESSQIPETDESAQPQPGHPQHQHIHRGIFRHALFFSTRLFVIKSSENGLMFLWTGTYLLTKIYNLYILPYTGCPLAPSAGQKTEFQIEELQRIVNAGTKTPVIILCLTELKRLTRVGGFRNSAVYKLNMHN